MAGIDIIYSNRGRMRFVQESGVEIDHTDAVVRVASRDFISFTIPAYLENSAATMVGVHKLPSFHGPNQQNVVKRSGRKIERVRSKVYRSNR